MNEWRLSGGRINNLQVDSLNHLIQRCKAAHYVDVLVRINGKDERHQADWLRHLTPAAPVAMILHCPACGTQHIDAPDERTPGWTNPPHRSHLCHSCGCIWRPADVATVGVASLETKGKADTWPTTTKPGSPP